MKYNFDTLVNRNGIGNMKGDSMPEHIKEAGICTYSGAEMDFKTAPVIIDAVKDLADNGLFGYTLADEKYFTAVAWWMKERRNWKISTEWIVPAPGTIHSVATAIRLLTKEGEGIIVQPPVYYRYEQAARRMGRTACYNRLRVENGEYKIDFEDLKQCMANPDNKLLVLCNPHNPVGKVWSKEDIAAIHALAKQHHVVVFSDEIFAEIIFDGHDVLPYALAAGDDSLFIVSTSLGKAFNFTGVNHANLIIPNKELREAFIKQRNMDHYGSMEPLAYVSLCAGYSEEGARWIDEMTAYTRENIRIICDFFSDHMPDVKVFVPEGGFVLWIDWTNLNLSGEELQDFLLQEAYLELDMGTEYDENGTFFRRMNIASPHAEIKKALEFLLKAARNRGLAKE